MALILAGGGLLALCVGRGDGSRAAHMAYERRASGVRLTVPGVVERVLEDYDRRPRQQRFIIRTDRDQTLVVWHNVERSARVPLREGQKVIVHGEYVWNPRGGALRNTHRARRGPGGWVRVVGDGAER